MAQTRAACQQRRAPVLLPFAVIAAALSLLACAPASFVPAPEAAAPAPRATASGAAAAGAAAGLLAPVAALAELPPLEDLPLDEVAPMRQFGSDNDTFLGVSFPMVLVFLLFAVSWAAFWVLNMMPKKDEEGAYKTYIGGGELPPEGYTNPLDPRLSEDYADEDDAIYQDDKKKGQKSASSAIV
mmetsp:Transcript_83421/g.269866  ORF Transcript_83421/g.269866 Transcript_83421/m.269866 type:complete len:184 (+) Transcript_83421:51-602(+)